MSDNPYHDHLDACEQCRNHPFALCTDGERVLRAFVSGEGRKPPVEEPLRGVHSKNGHAPHVTAEQARLATQRATLMKDPDRDVILAFIDHAERIESIALDVVDAYTRSGPSDASIDLLEHAIKGKPCCRE